MKKVNPQIKKEITIQDEINTIETIANIYFKETVTDDGDVITKYTPYFEKVGQINAIVRFLIDGVEVDDKEDVYIPAMNDEDIRPIIDQFFVQPGEKVKTLTFYQQLFNQIMVQVYNIVEYRKAENLAKIQNESNAVLNYKLIEMIDKEHEKSEKEIKAIDNLNKWIDEQREINSLITPEMQRDFAEKFDVNSMIDTMIKHYGESDLHSKNHKLIEANQKIREQENKIIELQDAYAKEQQKNSVKNVIADNKGTKPKTSRKHVSKVTPDDNAK